MSARSNVNSPIHDGYERCPLTAAGFTLYHFSELGTVVIGPDNRCVCTKESRCRNVDRRDGQRCTVNDLKQLDREASARRGRQSGEDY
jgi:hypothetical protein